MPEHEAGESSQDERSGGVVQEAAPQQLGVDTTVVFAVQDVAAWGAVKSTSGDR